MNMIDHRIAERRQQVTEDRARGRLKWLIWLVLVVVVVGATVWLVNSPLLSIRSVTVTGAERTNPAAIANSLDAGPGTPTMSVDAGAVEAALLDDPWIAQADVIVSWPG
ncbi:MAG: cell division protein FtsQ/DivIB, partial [Acidimicrobiia bacterium]